MMKYASLLIVALMATAATAAPVLDYTVTNLGDGLYGFTYYISNDDGLLASYAVNIGFEGVNGATIQQLGAFGGAVVVNKEDDANLYGGMPAANYDKTRDTWAMNPFANNAIAGVNPLTGQTIDGGYTVGPNMFAIALGTGPGSQIGSPVNVAYVVADGWVRPKYIIARAGVNYGSEYIDDPIREVYAGGPYEVGPGETILLDANWSGLGSGATFLWEIDGVEFDAGTDRTYSLSYDALMAAGFGPGEYTVNLTADYVGNYYDSTTLTIVPEPATLALLGLGAVALLRKRK